MQICYSVFPSSWLVTFGTPRLISSKAQSGDIHLQSIQGPIFFSLQFLVSPELYGTLLRKALKTFLFHGVQEIGYFQSSSCPVSQELPSSQLSCIPPKWKGFVHVRCSVRSFTSSMLLDFSFCLAEDLIPCPF